MIAQSKEQSLKEQNAEDIVAKKEEFRQDLADSLSKADKTWEGTGGAIGEGIDKAYIYAKYGLAGYELLMEEQFSEHLPRVYQTVGEVKEEVGKLILKGLIKTDKTLTDIFGDKYEATKDGTSKIAREIDKNAPEIVSDFIKFALVAGAANKLFKLVKPVKQLEAKWGYWGSYEKTYVGSKEYAKVGDWVYTRHAIENLYPSKMGMAPGHTSSHYPVGLPPKFVNDILNDKTTKVLKYGVRTIYQSGDLKVVTEGNTVITVTRIKKVNK